MSSNQDLPSIPSSLPQPSTRLESDQETDLPPPEASGLRVGGRRSWLGCFSRFLHLDHFSASPSMIWFFPAYVIDWGLGLVAVVVAKLYLETAKPYYRDLSVYYANRDYHWDLRAEQVSDEWLHHLSVTLPLILLIVLTLVAYPMGGMHLIQTLHHSLLGLLTSHAISIIPTDLLKTWVGALRPDFFSRCTYSIESNVCKPKFHNIKLMEDGMKSFPSGHCTNAFAGLGFLALWLAGRNGAFAIGGDGLRAGGPFQSRLLKGFIASFWLLVALWIALTRIQDHRHHPQDVIAGSLIGLISAFIAYLLYFPSPFDGSILTSQMGKPRLVYDHDPSSPHKQATTDVHTAAMPTVLVETV
ncbi:hypothetical protein O181_036946 [Austropuccinia psidii MF-1]|uniref:Phosphatidic acid phosphatase type 2/haloperoxidase domain-containing protein n=1 Tax=Austropuccinia psidii MF-1 TaxID=1389203 RepID=A0A9Q3HAC3_9BASI|nr:hypothetical protein [Austropuccinia psidii MF-1]